MTLMPQHPMRQLLSGLAVVTTTLLAVPPLAGQPAPAPEARVTAEVRGLLAADPLLRRVRYDGAELKQDGAAAKLLIRGICLGDDDTRRTEVRRRLRDLLSKELLPRLKQARGAFPERVELVLDEADRAKPATPAFRFVPSPLVGWQRAAGRNPALDGVVFLDAAYLADGTLQVIGLIDAQPQEAAARALVKSDGAVTVTLLPVGVRWRQELQKVLAASTGDTASLARQTLLRRVVWEVTAEGEQEVKLHGLSIHPLSPAGEVPLRKQLQTILQTNLHALLATVKARLLIRPPADTPADRRLREAVGLLRVNPVTEATEIVFVRNPVQLVRDRAVGDASLSGMVLADPFFDETGTLRLAGLVRSEAQRKDVAGRVAGALANVGVSPVGLRLLAEDELPARVQRVFAAGEGRLTRRTRLDRAAFAYVRPAGGGDPEPRLTFAGVSLTPAAEAVALRDRLHSEAITFLAAEKIPLGLRPEQVVSAEVRHLPSPLPALQTRSNADPALDGVLFTDVSYSESGVLRLDALAADLPRQQAAVEALVAKAGLAEDVVTPAGAGRAAAVTVRGHARAAQVKDWADLLATLQADLAGAGGRLAAARLDRAFFTLDAAEKPTLAFTGVNLYDVNAETADGKALADAFRKVSEAERSKLLASDAYRTPVHDRLRARLQVESRKRLTKPDYAVGVGSMALVASPAPAAQRALPETVRTRGAVVVGLRFSGRGDLEVRTRFLAADQNATVQTALATALRDSAALRPGASVVVDAAGGAVDWPGWLVEWQKRRAASKEPAARQTRLEGAAFAYDTALYLTLAVEGVSLHPGKERAPLAAALQTVTEPELKALGHAYRIDVEKLRGLADPLRQIQALAVADARLDGVLLTGAVYDAVGVLRLEGFRGEDGERTRFSEVVGAFLKRTPLLRPADRIEDSLAALQPLAWRSIVERLQATLAGSTEAARQRTRLDRAFFVHGNDGAELRFRGVSLDAGKQADELLRFLEAEVRGALPALKNTTFTPTLDGTFFIDSPILALQRQVVTDRLDGVLFRDARYDARGRLLLDVLPGTDGQRAAVTALLERRPPAEASLPPAERKIEPRWQTTFAPALDWGRLVRDMRAAFRRGPDDLLGRRTRLDRAHFAHGADSTKVQLRWQGVSIHNDDTREVVQAEIARRLAAGTATLPGVKPEVVATNVTIEENPTRTLQAALPADPDTDGVLFEDAGYDADGRLQLHLLLADAKQKAVVDRLIKDGAVPARVVAPEGVVAQPVVESRLFNLDALLRQVQTRLAGDTAGRRVRIDRGQFAYPADAKAGAQLTVGGVLLKPLASADEEKTLAARLIDEATPRLPRLRAGAASVRPDLQVIDSPARFLQPFVATLPALDGIGLTVAAFEDDGKLRLEGVWRSDRQEAELRRTAELVLPRLGGRLTRRGLALRLVPLATDQLLASLRQWTADTLEEAWVERLYFDRRNRLTARGIVAQSADVAAIGAKLTDLARAVPSLEGKMQLGGATAGRERTTPMMRLVSLQGTPRVEADPGMDFRSRPAVGPRLRELLQLPVDAATPSSRRWDGVLIRRGYYTPEGRFGLHGLCDSAGQRRELTSSLGNLDDQSAYREAFAGGIDLAGLRAAPLTPLLERIRVVLPAYPAFDGLAVDSAGQDVENRLVLRVRATGISPKADLAETLRKQLLAHPEGKVRAEKGLRWEVLGRQSGNAELGAGLRQQAVADLRLAMSGSGDGAAYNQAVRQLTTALQHQPDDSTAWYLRAMVHVLRGDDEQARRDLRRMHTLERAGDYGQVRRMERLRRSEPLQGDVRRRLELLHRQVVQDVKRNAPPLTVAGDVSR